MSSQRSILSSVFSWTFLVGLVAGLMLGAAGIILYAWYSMAQAGSESIQEADLEAPDVPERERTVSYGTVSDDWTLHSVSEEDSTQFGALKGKPVLINKWATWCVPCRAEMPTLEALHDSTGENVRLAVISEESRGHVRRYVENGDYTMPVYVVDEVPAALQGLGIPRTYVVRPDGQVVYRHTGVADWDAAPVYRFLNRFTVTDEAS